MAKSKSGACPQCGGVVPIEADGKTCGACRLSGVPKEKPAKKKAK